MFKTTLIAVIAALGINIAGFKAYDIYIEEQLNGQVTTTNYLNDKITELKSNLLEVRANSVGSITRSEFDDSIKDTKLFVQYEVSMNKKSIQAFIDSLNKDMDRLNTIANLSQTNDEYFQEQVELIMREVEFLKEIKETQEVSE
jgi:hypothetical protein